MAESIFMRVSEVAEELGVSQSYAYKLVRQLNKELAETGPAPPSADDKRCDDVRSDCKGA